MEGLHTLLVLPFAGPPFQCLSSDSSGGEPNLCFCVRLCRTASDSVGRAAAEDASARMDDAVARTEERESCQTVAAVCCRRDQIKSTTTHINNELISGKGLAAEDRRNKLCTTMCHHEQRNTWDTSYYRMMPTNSSCYRELLFLKNLVLVTFGR